MAWRAWAALAAGALMVAAGCGLPSTPAMGVPAPAFGGEGPLDPAVVAAWAGFPATARPRPIVISAPPRLPDNGFTTDTAKLAAMAGHYVTAARLPADPPATLPVTLPDGRAQLPSITARQAVDALSTGKTGPVLPITRVVLGTATFSSDRGPLTLPAWLFTAPGAAGPIAWPAIAPSAFWKQDPNTPVTSGNAWASADGRTVTVTLAALGNFCPGDLRFAFRANATESPSTVAVSLYSEPDGIEPGAPQPNCALADVGHVAAYTVPLTAPLGSRVLLGPLGVGSTQVLAVEPG